MTLDTRTLKLAHAIERKLWANYLEYLEACEEDHKRGYRAHYCEHGTNNWTDYDNICGPCEDGLFMSDPITRRRYAIDTAKGRMAKYDAIMAAMRAFAKVVGFDAVNINVVSTLLENLKAA